MIRAEKGAWREKKKRRKESRRRKRRRRNNILLGKLLKKKKNCLGTQIRTRPVKEWKLRCSS